MTYARTTPETITRRNSLLSFLQSTVRHRSSINFFLIEIYTRCYFRRYSKIVEICQTRNIHRINLGSLFQYFLAFLSFFLPIGGVLFNISNTILFYRYFFGLYRSVVIFFLLLLFIPFFVSLCHCFYCSNFVLALFV